MLQKIFNFIKNRKSSDRINKAKFCISATGPNLDSLLDPRFGRAMFFLIIDNEGNLIKKIENTGVQAMRGAGVTAAQLVVNENINAVISGNIGPNAFEVLHNSGIKIYVADSGTVKDVFKEYQKGNLREINETSPKHFNHGRGFGRREGL